MDKCDCLHLISEIPPSVNHYLGYRGIFQNGKIVIVSYKTKEAVKYQNAFMKHVEEQVKAQGWVTDLDYAGHFYVDATFYMDRTHRDTNNTWKCMLDAITYTKLVWRDDDVVCERTNGILYDSANPRVELTIHKVDYIGIFDNVAQLERFKSNCFGCKRYKRNCSLLNNASAGKIQPEINDDLVCSKYSKLKEE